MTGCSATSGNTQTAPALPPAPLVTARAQPELSPAPTPIPSPTPVSYELPTQAIGWTIRVRILIDGEEVPIPGELGFGESYASSPYYEPRFKSTIMHTHAPGTAVSWETLGRPPRLEDLYLGAIFEVWGKPFSRNCILDRCAGAGKAVKMSVNGKANTDFERYLVRNRDEIVIRYE